MEEYLLPELAASTISLMFMQDGARCHTCPNSIQFFSANGVVLFGSWPPQSPDMNPIEWVWGNMKQKLQYVLPFPKTRKELIDAVMKIWDDLSTEYRHKLIERMDYRMEEVISRKGHWTKY